MTRKSERRGLLLVLNVVAILLAVQGAHAWYVADQPLAGDAGTTYFGLAATHTDGLAAVAGQDRSTSQGRVFLFASTKGVWESSGVVLSADESQSSGNDYFGTSLATKEASVVGLPVSNTSASASSSSSSTPAAKFVLAVGARGAAYVYPISDRATWTPAMGRDRLVPSTTDTTNPDIDFFGHAVCLNAKWLLVSAPYTNGFAGSVYVYTYSSQVQAPEGGIPRLGFGPQPVHVIQEDTQDQGMLGFSLAMRGDTIFSGAYGSRSYAGGVYVYRINMAATPLEISADSNSHFITRAGAQDYDYFGISIAVPPGNPSTSPSLLAIGASGVDSFQGAVFLFSKSASTQPWTQAGAPLRAAAGSSTSTPAGTPVNDYFGFSVTMSSDFSLIAGAYGRDTYTGAVYVYTLADTWRMSGTQFPAPVPPLVHSSQYGYAISADNSTALVTAYGAKSFQGLVYHFTKDPLSPIFTGSLSASGSKSGSLSISRSRSRSRSRRKSRSRSRSKTRSRSRSRSMSYSFSMSHSGSYSLSRTRSMSRSSSRSSSRSRRQSKTRPLIQTPGATLPSPSRSVSKSPRSRSRSRSGSSSRSPSFASVCPPNTVRTACGYCTSGNSNIELQFSFSSKHAGFLLDKSTISPKAEPPFNLTRTIDNYQVFLQNVSLSMLPSGNSTTELNVSLGSKKATLRLNPMHPLDVYPKGIILTPEIRSGRPILSVLGWVEKDNIPSRELSGLLRLSIDQYPLLGATCKSDNGHPCKLEIILPPDAFSSQLQQNGIDVSISLVDDTISQNIAQRMTAKWSQSVVLIQTPRFTRPITPNVVISLPNYVVLRGQSYNISLDAYTPGTYFGSLNMSLSFESSHQKFKRVVTSDSISASYQLNRDNVIFVSFQVLSSIQTGSNPNLQTGSIPLCLLEFESLPNSPSNGTFSSTVYSMFDTQNTRLINSATPGFVYSKSGIDIKGVVQIQPDPLLGHLMLLNQASVYNIAPLTNEISSVGLTIYEIHQYAGLVDVTSSSVCTVSEPDSIKVLGCQLFFDGTETKGADAIEISFRSEQTFLRVLFPQGDPQISLEDPTLNAFAALAGTDCENTYFQRTKISAQQSFATESLQVITDVTPLLTFSSSQPTIASVHGTKIIGHAVGEARISANGFSTYSTLTVTTDPVSVTSLNPVVFTDIKLSAESLPQTPLDENRFRVSAAIAQELPFENTTADIVIFASFSDFARMELDETDGLLLTSMTSALEIHRNPLRVVSKRSECGRHIVAQWSMCGVRLGSGRTIINSIAPTLESVELSLPDGDEIAIPNRIPHAAGLPTRIRVIAIGIYSDGTRLDLSGDPRIVWDASSGDPRDLIKIDTETLSNNTKISYVSPTTKGTGNVVLNARISSTNRLSPLSIPVKVIGHVRLELMALQPFNLTATLPRYTTLGRIGCSQVRQSARLRLDAVLTNGQRYDITLSSLVVFELGDTTSSNIVQLNDTLIVPFGSQTGAISIIGRVGSDATRLNIQVTNTAVPITKLSLLSDSNIAATQGTVYQPRFSISLSDDSFLPSIQDLSIPVTYTSSRANVLQPSTNRQILTVSGNSDDPVSISASVCSTASTQWQANVNLVAAVGDVDIGTQGGIPIPRMRLAQVETLPITINSGQAGLAIFDITLNYDYNLVDVLSCTIGVDWRSGIFQTSLNDPVGVVRIQGVMYNQRAPSGQAVHVANLIVRSKGNGVSSLFGTINQLLSGPLADIPIGNIIQSGSARSIVAGKVTIMVGASLSQTTSRSFLVDEKAEPKEKDRIQWSARSCIPSSVLGNVDGDCQFSLRDIYFTLYYLNSVPRPVVDDYQIAYMDADADGIVSVADISLSLRILAGKLPFMTLNIIPTTTTNPSFTNTITLRDAQGSFVSDSTSVVLNYTTIKNRDMVIGLGSSRQQIPTGVSVRALSQGSGRYTVQGFVGSLESNIGITVTLQTVDSLGVSSTDRKAIFYGYQTPSNQFFGSMAAVYNGTLPPGMISAEFDGFAQFVTVKFDSDTNKGNQNNTFPCQNVFVGLTSLTCEWRSPRLVIINSACSEKLVVGGQLSLVNNVITSQIVVGSAIYSRGTTIITMSSPEILISVGLSAPQLIGRCSPLRIDSSTSSIVGNRCPGIQYKWSFVSSPPVNAANRVAIDAKLDQSTFLVDLNDELPPGYSYTFSLSLSTIYGISDSQSITVTKSSEAIPTILLDGLSERSVFTNRLVELRGLASVPSCISADSMQFEWRQMSGPEFQLDPIGRVSKVLTIPSFQLRPLETYVFQLTGCVPLETGSSCNDAYVTLNTMTSGIRARIAGGSQGVAGTSRDFELDASGSTDLDYQVQVPGSLLFEWSCTDVSSGTPCQTPSGQSLNLTNTAVLTIYQKPNVTLAAGNYTFAVFVAKRTNPETKYTATKSIQVLDNDPPVVSIVPPSQTRPSPSIPHSIQGIVSSTNGNRFAYSWAVSGGSSSMLDIGIEPHQANGTRILIPAGKLRQNTEYTITFYVTNRDSNVMGYSQITFQTNMNPYGGTFVTPINGTQMDSFKFEARGWTSLSINLPLTFAFGYRLKLQGPIQIVSSFGQSVERNIILPAGEIQSPYPGMTRLEAIALISDINGNVVEASRFIDLHEIVFSSDADRVEKSSEFVSSGMSSALAMGDFDLLAQYALGSMAILNSAEASRRSAACPSSNSASVRETAFSLLTEANQQQKFYTATQSDSNIKQYAAVLGSDCLSSNLTENAPTLLKELAANTRNTSVADTTGSSLLAAFSNIHSHISRSGDVNQSSVIVHEATQASKDISRAAMTTRQCGETPYTSDSSLLQVASFIQCGDSDPQPIQIDADGNPGVTLSKEAYGGGGGNPVVHVVNQEINPYVDAPDNEKVTSSILQIELESSPDASANTGFDTIPVDGLNDEIIITLARRKAKAGEDEVDENGLPLEPSCEFFNETTNEWSTKGCRRVSFTDTQIVCSCKHLTSFASVLRRITEIPVVYQPTKKPVAITSPPTRSPKPTISPSRSHSDQEFVTQMPVVFSATDGRCGERYMSIIGGFVGAGSGLIIYAVFYMVRTRYAYARSVKPSENLPVVGDKNPLKPQPEDEVQRPSSEGSLTTGT